MAKAYMVARIDVTDAHAYQTYVQQVSPIVEQYGGRYLVRAGKLESVEGEPPPPRVVVIEFPSFEQARAWYESDEYAPVKAIRLSASVGSAFLVEGAS